LGYFICPVEVCFNEFLKNIQRLKACSFVGFEKSDIFPRWVFQPDPLSSFKIVSSQNKHLNQMQRFKFEKKITSLRHVRRRPQRMLRPHPLVNPKCGHENPPYSRAI
jgi:hypothetical protein